MGKIFSLIFILIFIGLAIMFDWFGARDLSQKGLDATQNTVERLNEAGDKISEAVEKIESLPSPTKE